MICAENLFKFYGRKAAVSDLSVSVKTGEVLGFIGPNGAGKTTTMKMLCGVMPITRGKAVICGSDISKNPLKAKSHIGYLPENAPLYSGMLVKSFLHYCADMHNINKDKVAEKIDKAVKRCSLDSVLDDDLDSLSKGFKRRVCLAQAIMHEPEVLILDEPTDGLDPNQKREIRNLIMEIRERSAIIVSTHILEEVEAVCDRVAVIVAGKKVFDGRTPEFRALSPDDGSIDLVVASSDEKLVASVFGNLKMEITSAAHGKTHLKILKGNKPVERLMPELYSIANEKGLDIVSCRINTGQLDAVFAKLSADCKEEGRI